MTSGQDGLTTASRTGLTKLCCIPTFLIFVELPNAAMAPMKAADYHYLYTHLLNSPRWSIIFNVVEHSIAITIISL